MTIREQLPLVDPPKVTLHDDNTPYVEPLPFTIPLPSCCPVSGAATLNGGGCNHMGGGVVIGDPSEGGEESTIIFEATGFPTCTLNGITEGAETGGKGTEAAN